MDDVRNKILALLLGLVIVVVATLMLTRIIDYGISSSEDRAFQSAFTEIKVGMGQTEAIAILGNPDKREAEFHLGQRDGFEDAYLRGEVSAVSLLAPRNSCLFVGVDGTGFFA